MELDVCNYFLRQGAPPNTLLTVRRLFSRTDLHAGESFLTGYLWRLLQGRSVRCEHVFGVIDPLCSECVSPAEHGQEGEEATALAP